MEIHPRGGRWGSVHWTSLLRTDLPPGGGDGHCPRLAHPHSDPLVPDPTEHAPRTTPAGGAWENTGVELTYYGHSCVRIRGREATIAYDPYTSIVGPTGRGITADIVTLSHPDDAPLARVKGRLAPRDGRTPIATSLDNAVVLEGPGEYEVKSVLITGIRSYRDSHRGGAARHNTVFYAEIDGMHVVHLGDHAEGFSTDQIKELPGADIVLIPVGGALSAEAASALINQLGPKIVIPMPMTDDVAKANAAVKAFCKEEGLTTPPTAQPKLTITISGLPEETTTIVVEPRGEAFGAE